MFVELQGCICTILVVRCMPSAWVTRVFSFRVGTATSITAFIRRPSVRSRRAAVSASSTIRTLHICLLSPSHVATRPYSSWPRCARYDWALWRAGAPSTTDRMSQAPPAGSKSILMDHFIGLIKCWQRWAPHIIPSHQYHKFICCFIHISDDIVFVVCYNALLFDMLYLKSVPLHYMQMS